ncbi:type I-D CRISPR-associated protein Cas7/Csc2 [Desertifilum sp. FACHB-1129]|uniref:Type I-D CRISPR-associated protein Cas7/Csc2 n=2 Tax=Desertifilum tharense IPPAS B-1220 TaxID=1781255 RepID=A0A1E5QGR6_9CYAN|nr:MULTISPECIES: type I-D CRISPR-associated protein Cas7/Csc2 [Desertifilum]MDA0209604.1 type I-D CRISPR-associated protein Cas7/Csc2 [Cyanobacteria bacterium FC1]MBD2313014.1 type I-D CRISPR-associated protein Cas7/Csc2 [Desertifilum sp. FACHB-1129]MBD2320940.1 type I-D CRISPR-associated protein Cas7/Csc2 [Desertifilum sp. FACHB-866]MBD2331069.1 type I-D CRISPR-associated protein Cas7/Csc2 [Desertifilum sp. FACHB-868]OEJ73882.1 type I-D CRISPR-associated protein Cas7/Csc2 [Desertifilum tharen
MSLLKSVDQKFFHSEIPAKPMGKYAHFVTIRVTESYPLFQTDGELNKARVRAGINHRETISRLAMFKRKQSTPERLTGRELLRNYQIGDWEKCDYNVDFSKTTPDCVLYGFAIGDSGSEKSKVVVDTAYSITPFDDSHLNFTLNAPFENGTMSRQGEVTSRINSQDHILPQVFFPSIVTLKDPTEAGFLYVFNNILRTRHYGAQTTRTGRVRNELVGVIFADGEIVSNLRWTQKVYDLMADRGQIQAPDPLNEDDVLSAAQEAISVLMTEECIPHTDFIGDSLTSLLAEVKAITSNEIQLRELLNQANVESTQYAQKYILKTTSEKSKKGSKKGAATSAE